MNNLFIAWELGGGLGHLTELLPISIRLQTGHNVTVALRDLHYVAKVADLSGVTALQSPVRHRGCQDTISTPRTFAHVLWNAAYNKPSELQSLVSGWDMLFDVVRPDIIIFDHAPTAALAARGKDVQRIVLGNGFSIPTDCQPLPDLRPWMPSDPERLTADEHRILANMNRVLEDRGVEPLERITQLYSDVDETFLTTLPEFDHYPARQGARYRGPWSIPGGIPPIWPAGNGNRIYAYLSPFLNLPKILSALRAIGCPTIVFGNFDQQTRERFAAPHIRFEVERLDLRQVATECDVAVLNAGHISTLQFLLAGKPILQAPIFLEHAITALNTIRIGAGLVAFPRGDDRTVEQLRELLYNPRYAESARMFAARYANFSAEAEIADAVQRLHELASS